MGGEGSKQIFARYLRRPGGTRFIPFPSRGPGTTRASVRFRNGTGGYTRAVGTGTGSDARELDGYEARGMSHTSSQDKVEKEQKLSLDKNDVENRQGRMRLPGIQS